MNKVMLTMVASLFLTTAFSQQQKGRVPGYSVGAEYSHEFVLGGYVRVREWDLQGDKLNLKDLGMTSYPAVKVYGERRLNENSSIGFGYDHYFMTGTATINRDVAYNGTIINGRRGLDVSPTRYNRFTLTYRTSLIAGEKFEMQGLAAVVVEHITFYVDGEVVPGSPRAEVYERFGKQAFPYPLLGLRAGYAVGSSGQISLQVSGTYVPEFKSFYKEQGHMHLQYSNFQAEFSYSKNIAAFEMSGGARFRYMRLFQESREDTNILQTITTGPFVAASYHF